MDFPDKTGTLTGMPTLVGPPAYFRSLIPLPNVVSACQSRGSHEAMRGVSVKLPYVEYEAPTTVAEAVGLLAEHEDEASVLAGGQSLIPLMALRLAPPAVPIDINGLTELALVKATDGQVTIGAMTREYVAEDSATIGDTVPLLAAALPLIGHEAIRSRGTIGGSLAHP